MTISARTSPVMQSGTTAAVTWTLPTGHSTGDLLILGYACKPYSVTMPAPAEYTASADIYSSTTASGAGTGGVYGRAFWKTHDGSEANPTATASGGTTPHAAGTLALYSNLSGSWTVSSTTGADSTPGGAGIDATGASTLNVGAGDYVVVVTGVPDDQSNISSATLTIDGCTVGAAVNHVRDVSGTSNDIAFAIFGFPITGGTATAPPQFQATVTAGDSEAPVIFVGVIEPGKKEAATAVTVTPTAVATPGATAKPATGINVNVPPTAAAAGRSTKPQAATTTTVAISATAAGDLLQPGTPGERDISGSAKTYGTTTGRLGMLEEDPLKNTTGTPVSVTITAAAAGTVTDTSIADATVTITAAATGRNVGSLPASNVTVDITTTAFGYIEPGVPPTATESWGNIPILVD